MINTLTTMSGREGGDDTLVINYSSNLQSVVWKGLRKWEEDVSHSSTFSPCEWIPPEAGGDYECLHVSGYHEAWLAFLNNRFDDNRNLVASKFLPVVYLTCNCCDEGQRRRVEALLWYRFDELPIDTQHQLQLRGLHVIRQSPVGGPPEDKKRKEVKSKPPVSSAAKNPPQPRKRKQSDAPPESEKKSVKRQRRNKPTSKSSSSSSSRPDFVLLVMDVGETYTFGDYEIPHALLNGLMANGLINPFVSVPPDSGLREQESVVISPDIAYIAMGSDFLLDRMSTFNMTRPVILVEDEKHNARETVPSKYERVPRVGTLDLMSIVDNFKPTSRVFNPQSWLGNNRIGNKHHEDVIPQGDVIGANRAIDDILSNPFHSPMNWEVQKEDLVNLLLYGMANWSWGTDTDDVVKYLSASLLKTPALYTWFIRRGLPFDIEQFALAYWDDEIRNAWNPEDRMSLHNAITSLDHVYTEHERADMWKDFVTKLQSIDQLIPLEAPVNKLLSRVVGDTAMGNTNESKADEHMSDVAITPHAPLLVPTEDQRVAGSGSGGGVLLDLLDPVVSATTVYPPVEDDDELV